MSGRKHYVPIHGVTAPESVQAARDRKAGRVPHLKIAEEKGLKRGMLVRRKYDEKVYSIREVSPSGQIFLNLRGVQFGRSSYSPEMIIPIGETK